MKCLLDGWLEGLLGAVNTDEDYERMVRAKNKIMVGFIVLGCILMAMSIAVGTDASQVQRQDFLSGLYAGAGCGMAAAALVNLFRNRKLLKDKEKLHRDRVKRYDERAIAISQKSMQSAGILVFLIATVGTLIGGFFNMAIFWCFWGIMILFSVSYLVGFAFFSRRM